MLLTTLARLGLDERSRFRHGRRVVRRGLVSLVLLAGSSGCTQLLGADFDVTLGAEETGTDSSPSDGTEVDSTIDSAVDTGVDSTIDSAIDSTIDSTIDTAVDSNVDSTVVDSAVDSADSSDSEDDAPEAIECGDEAADVADADADSAEDVVDSADADSFVPDVTPDVAQDVSEAAIDSADSAVEICPLDFFDVPAAKLPECILSHQVKGEAVLTFAVYTRGDDV